LEQGDLSEIAFYSSTARAIAPQDQVVINIFVGNLDSSATEQHLYSLFERYGSVEIVTIVKDRDTGEARGFGFVEMTRFESASSDCLFKWNSSK
jgi:RNA recognition motif-containing protein